MSEERHEESSQGIAEKIVKQPTLEDSKHVKLKSKDVYPYLSIKETITTRTEKDQHYQCYMLPELMKLTPEMVHDNKYVRTAGYVLEEENIFYLISGTTKNYISVRINFSTEIELVQPTVFVEIFGKIYFDEVKLQYLPYIDVYFYTYLEGQYSDYNNLSDLLKNEHEIITKPNLEVIDYISEQHIQQVEDYFDDVQNCHNENLFSELYKVINAKETELENQKMIYSNIKKLLQNKQELQNENSKAPNNEFLNEINEYVADKIKNLTISYTYLSTLNEKINSENINFIIKSEEERISNEENSNLISSQKSLRLNEDTVSTEELESMFNGSFVLNNNSLSKDQMEAIFNESMR